MADAMTDLISLQGLQSSIAAAARAGTLTASSAPELRRQLLLCAEHIRAAGLDVESELVDPLIAWGKSDVLAPWVQHPERDRAPYLAVFGVVAEMQERFG